MAVFEGSKEVKGYTINSITRDMIKPWLMNRHYAKRIPPISFSFGLFKSGLLVGVVSYGVPASPSLCKGVCGLGWKDNVLELNRLVLLNNLKNEASYLVGNSLKLLQNPTIVVSYADTKMNHIGYVYQATNWIYTGCTKPRTDMFSESGHSRHNEGDSNKRQPRSAKHRYIFFVADKRTKRTLIKALNYKIMKYPKGENEYYETSKKDIPALQTSMF